MFPTFDTLLIEVTPPFARIILNRPRVKNAMNHAMVEALIGAFTYLYDRTDVRAVVLTGAGGTFCAGGDLSEMQSAAEMTESQQLGQTERFDYLLRLVNSAPQVVIARIEGAALGGGFGLVCVTDVALATVDARLGLPEVRLGLVPAVISPYVIRRVGLTRARQLMLTGARFDGAMAQTYGIVHEALPANALDVRLDALLDEIHHCAPGALRACKAMLHTVADSPLEETLQGRAELLNRLRVADEAQEGMQAFLEKRRASWAR